MVDTNLLDMPEDVVARIIGLRGYRAGEFALTSTRAMQQVLAVYSETNAKIVGHPRAIKIYLEEDDDTAGHPRVYIFKLSTALVRVLQTFPKVPKTGLVAVSVLVQRGGEPDNTWTMTVPLDALVTLTHTVQQPGEHFTLDPPTLASVVSVTSHKTSRALPGGMASLKEIHTDGCSLWTDWLPESSGAGVEKLIIVESHNGRDRMRVPQGMASLEVLVMVRTTLATQWMPESSAGRVADVKLCAVRGCTDIPPSMMSLQKLYMEGSLFAGHRLLEVGTDWLPECVARNLRKLVMLAMSVEHLPPGMKSLEELVLRHVDGLADDWLPESSRAQVRELSLTNVAQLPTDMASLVKVELHGYPTSEILELADDWMPESSRAHVRELDLFNCDVTHVPTGMTSLEKLAIDRCPNMRVRVTRGEHLLLM